MIKIKCCGDDYMTKYQWDINKIRKLKQDCINNTQLLNNKKLFNSQQEFYDILIKFYMFDKLYTYMEYNETDEPIDDEFFIPNIEALNIIEKLNQNINNLQDKQNPYLNQRIFLNNNELIELVREFVNLIPSKELNASFDKFFNPKNHFVNINYTKIPFGIHGITKTDYINKICYSGILRENSLNDIITVFHEFFHMHIRNNESYDFFETNKVIYGEVEGCFANFLINNLSNQLGIDKDLFLFSIYDEFNYILESLNKLYIYKKILDLKKHKIYSNNWIYEMTNDSISYLTALDLFYLYEKDPEKALYNLFNIPNLSGENIEKELIQNDISFFEDNCKNLKRLYKSL